MRDIDRVMYLIHWHRSEEEQQEGIALAKEISSLKAFFQPGGDEGGKAVWDNCAEILYTRSDEELHDYTFDMLLWLQDLNWPGADRIQQRLIEFQDVSMLSLHLNHLVPALDKLGEDFWLYFPST